jgi:hypothetical protein
MRFFEFSPYTPYMIFSEKCDFDGALGTLGTLAVILEHKNDVFSGAACET